MLLFTALSAGVHGEILTLYVLLYIHKVKFWHPVPVSVRCGQVSMEIGDGISGLEFLNQFQKQANKQQTASFIVFLQVIDI